MDAQPRRTTLNIVCSALVEIDMQNDFCNLRGWFGQNGIGVKPMRLRPAAPTSSPP